MMSQRRRYLVSRLKSQLFANNGRHRADIFCRGGFLIICPAADCATAVITMGDQSICACALSRTRQLERSAATGRSDILIVNVKTNMSFSALKWVDKWTLAISIRLSGAIKKVTRAGLLPNRVCLGSLLLFWFWHFSSRHPRTAEKKQRVRNFEADKSI